MDKCSTHHYFGETLVRLLHHLPEVPIGPSLTKGALEDVPLHVLKHKALPNVKVGPRFLEGNNRGLAFLTADEKAFLTGALSLHLLANSAASLASAVALALALTAAASSRRGSRALSTRSPCSRRSRRREFRRKAVFLSLRIEIIFVSWMYAGFLN